MTTNAFDCVIAGGGPAGAAAATLLAQAGKSVLVVEREAFPRFHVGESLLPASNAMLKRLGVWESLDTGGAMRKYGAEFLHGDGEQCVHAIFEQGLKAEYEYTFQVERARFDQLLLERAREVGAEVLQPARVVEIADDAAGWQVTIENAAQRETITAKWFLDASGRHGVLARHLDIPLGAYPLPKRFAVYNHFRGVERRPGRERGNITITRLADGWFWSIPLDDERTSLGLVTRGQRDGRRPADIFEQAIRDNPFMSKWMRNAESLGEFRVEADFSFRREQLAGKNWLLLGDAAGFIDPVFSSGVFLALESAKFASDAILSANGQLSPSAQAGYQRELRSRQELIFGLVSLFYDNDAFSVFMNPSNKFQLFDAVNAVIAGRAERDIAIRWRFTLFRMICSLNRRLHFIPAVKL